MVDSCIFGKRIEVKGLQYDRGLQPKFIFRAAVVEESNGENDLVAPLLRSVAKEVQQFATACGIARMPTKQEMHGLGRNLLVSRVHH